MITRRHRFSRALTISLLVEAVAALGCFTAPVYAAARGVSFRAQDGRTINAVVFEPSQRPAPAVVLVPMLGRPKDDWDVVAQRLADASILALAVDLPGQSDPGDSKVLAGWSTDVRAAISYLLSRQDVRAGSIGVAGASLGASLAAMAAADLPTVQSLVLVSPSLDYRGVRLDAPLKQYGRRPAMLIASNHDPYAARTVRDLAKESSGTRETRLTDTVGHGTILLMHDPDLVRALVEWFQATLR